MLGNSQNKANTFARNLTFLLNWLVFLFCLHMVLTWLSTHISQPSKVETIVSTSQLLHVSKQIASINLTKDFGCHHAWLSNSMYLSCNYLMHEMGEYGCWYHAKGGIDDRKSCPFVKFPYNSCKATTHINFNMLCNV